MAVRIVGNYEIGRKLGSGLQGKVYQGRDLRTNEIVALKFLDSAALMRNVKLYTNLQREVTAMQRIAPHPNVVGIKTVEWDVMKPKKKQIGKFQRCVMIVMTLASGGEIFDYLIQGAFREPIARVYAHQLLDALRFCHSQGVVHRDIKPENLLVDRDYNLLVADWGLSAVLDDAERHLLRTHCGTKAYMAPEILRRETYHGPAVDIWSVGVVLFIFIAGFPPFEQAAPGDWWYERCAEGKHSYFWMAHERSARFSDTFKDLLNRIFIADPRRRLTVEAALKHTWFLGDTATVADLHSEMHSRKLAIHARKGIAEPEEDALLGTAAGDVGATPTTATTATIAVGGVSGGGGGAGSGEDVMQTLAGAPSNASMSDVSTTSGTEGVAAVTTTATALLMTGGNMDTATHGQMMFNHGTAGPTATAMGVGSGSTSMQDGDDLLADADNTRSARGPTAMQRTTGGFSVASGLQERTMVGVPRTSAVAAARPIGAIPSSSVADVPLVLPSRNPQFAPIAAMKRAVVAAPAAPAPVAVAVAAPVPVPVPVPVASASAGPVAIAAEEADVLDAGIATRKAGSGNANAGGLLIEPSSQDSAAMVLPTKTMPSNSSGSSSSSSRVQVPEDANPEVLPADFFDVDTLTWLCIRNGSSQGLPHEYPSPASLTQSIVDFLSSYYNASITPKIKTKSADPTTRGIKLKIQQAATVGRMEVEIRVYEGRSGTPYQNTFIIDVTRTSGDVLAFNKWFATIANHFAPAIAQIEVPTASSVDVSKASVIASASAAASAQVIASRPAEVASVPAMHASISSQTGSDLDQSVTDTVRFI